MREGEGVRRKVGEGKREVDDEREGRGEERKREGGNKGSEGGREKEGEEESTCKMQHH